MKVLLWMLVFALLFVPSPSAAQTVARPPERPRFFIDIALSGTVQSPARGREFSARFIRFGEIATSRATYPRPSNALASPLTEVGGGVVFGRFLKAGVSHSRTVYEDAVSLEATIPHPIFLHVPATGTGTSAPLRRREAATHVFVAFVPLRMSKIEWRVQAGPSFFRFNADMIRDVLFDHTFSAEDPSGAIAITGGATEPVRATDVGAHVGTDVTYFFTRWIGLAGRVRYSQGTVTITPEPLSAVQQQVRLGNTLVFVGLNLRVGG